MKKLLSITLVLLMLIATASLASCDDKKDNKKKSDGDKKGSITYTTISFDFFTIKIPDTLSLISEYELGKSYSDMKSGEAIAISVSEHYGQDNSTFINPIPKTEEEAAQFVGGSGEVTDLEVIILSEHELVIWWTLANGPATLYGTLHMINYLPDDGTAPKTIGISILEKDSSRPYAEKVVPKFN